MTKKLAEHAQAAKGLTKKGAATRARILEEAHALLVEKGHHGLVLREVALHCGVKLGTVQYYFASHESLVLGVLEAEAARDLETIERAMAQDSPAKDRVRALAVELIERWSRESAVLYSTLLMLSQQSEPFRSLYQRIYANFYTSLVSAIEQVRPGLDRSETELRARLMTSLIDGAAMQTHEGSRARFLERVVEEACAIALS